MASRRAGYAGVDSSPAGGAARKPGVGSTVAGPGARAERAARGPGQGAGQGVTVTSLKSRLAPAVQAAMSAAVDTLLGGVVLLLQDSQQELLAEQLENERLRVRLEVSERELRTLHECLCSAQKLIDQLQVPYGGQGGPQGGPQHGAPQGAVFAPSLSSLSSMASMTPGLDREHQNPRNGVDLGLGGSVEDSLHGFEPRDDFKMCQLSIQPDGSVTNHSLDSFAANTPHLCSDAGRPDERQPQGPGAASRFEVKEEQGPVSSSGQPSRKDPGMCSDSQVGDGERSSHGVGDIGYGPVGGDGGSQRSFTHPLRHQRPVRECGNALQQSGLDGQKPLPRTSVAGRGDGVSPGRAEDSAGPSAPDTAPEASADRPHHCLECGKTFRLISSLKKHIRIHTGEKPYPCAVCGRRFRESGALKTHLRIHTGEKPYSCSECGNSFRHLDGLRKHRRTHTGEKPYVCTICGKRLSRLQHLKHHQLIHTGERPCCCPFCNRTFKEPAALRKHIRTHRDEGGHMGIPPIEETDQDAMEDMNNLPPAAPSPQMRFGEWGPEEDDGSVPDCV
ncbi:zinc finger protein 316 [Cololabis saira]|uniref:zinc finger protein 316 n=1 Tax=Cololabis saira TaxID=129043 RepID=UPI002AD3934B|nr:zinc finger protein 316 [Cololabis saira]